MPNAHHKWKDVINVEKEAILTEMSFVLPLEQHTESVTYKVKDNLNWIKEPGAAAGHRKKRDKVNTVKSGDEYAFIL